MFHTTAPDCTRRSEAVGAAHTDVPSPWKPSPLTLAQRGRWLIDSLLLVCLLAFVCVVANRPAASVDEDLWWHMSTGAWILNHRAVSMHDVFAAYTAGKPWIAYTWHFDVISSKLYSAGGLQGILTLTTSLMIGFISELVLLLARYATMLCAISLTFIILELHFLLQARDHSQPGWLLPVVPLMALWANRHIHEAPLYNPYGWGGYLTWRLPGMPVSIDRRANLQGMYGWRVLSPPGPDGKTGQMIRNS